MTTILIADDDDNVRYALSKLLRKAGYDVQEAQNGKEAFKLLRKAMPDVLVTDIVMPELDGMGLLNQARQLNPSIPVLVMSGGGNIVGLDYLSLAQTMGANATLCKPFDNDEVLSVVANLVVVAERHRPH
ncbi:MAG: response regulator [Burkholderiales bacterium]|nr:response regulator [Burkholderiales bacterium]